MTGAYSGTAAISHLLENLDADDPSVSSHWRKYHSEFRFANGQFSGLHGFGGLSERPRGARAIAHRLLQRRYRRLASAWPEFAVADRIADDITRKQERAYDLDVLRQSLTLAFLRRHAPHHTRTDSTACVIGDGFGTMTALLLGTGSARRVILFNLVKTLLVDLWYLKLWMGNAAFQASVELVTDETGLRAALGRTSGEGAPADGRVIAIQASNHHLLADCRMDLVVNIASMQEMDPPVIAEYFNDLREAGAQQPLMFYCCNREEKRFPDGTVTRFADYPWNRGDRVLVDELCPWHQQYYSLRPPFYRPYDGPIRHRLAGIGENSNHE